MNYPTLLLILDGVGDEPNDTLENRTPLQAASLPTFDRVAKAGQCGRADPIKAGKTASTAEGTLGILGYDPLFYTIGRGVVEAFGAGVSLEEGDVAFRGNFASLGEGGKVLDRRAGRIRDGVAELIEALERIPSPAQVEIIIGKGSEHRLALILRGEGLSAKISGSDPKDRNPNGLRITPHALSSEDSSAQRTAQILDQFEQEARKVLSEHPLNQERLRKGLLPANTILTRDPGILMPLPPFHVRDQPLRGMCIGGDRTVLGLAKMAAIEFYCSPQMTANLDTDLSAKFDAALERLNDYDLVLIHIKGCDIAAHDRQAQTKSDFLVKVDQAFEQFLKKWGEESPLRIGIIADHCTSSEKGYHISDPVPVIIRHPELSADFVQGYDEIQVAQGSLGRFPGHQFLEKLWYGNTLSADG